MKEINILGTDEELTPANLPPNLQEAAKLAGAAAANVAISSLATAAANAAKPGATTTEFKVTVGSIALAALVAGLKVFAVLPGPWTVPAVLALVGITAGSAAYTVSRGSVKKAALLGAAAVAVAAVKSALPPDDSGSQTGSA